MVDCVVLYWQDRGRLRPTMLFRRTNIPDGCIVSSGSRRYPCHPDRPRIIEAGCWTGIALANADSWATPYWQFYRKHLPPNPRTKRWGQLVRETAVRGHPAYYHQNYLGRIEQLEMDCFQNGAFLYESGPVRYYWHECDEVIGASCGEETYFVLIEYHQSGCVHGHPVTWQELEDKGAKDEDRRT